MAHTNEVVVSGHKNMDGCSVVPFGSRNTCSSCCDAVLELTYHDSHPFFRFSFLSIGSAKKLSRAVVLEMHMAQLRSTWRIS